MKDYLVRALGYHGLVRAYALDATAAVKEAACRHETLSGSTIALGRTLVAGLLFGASALKGDDRLTIKVQGDGPAGNIIVDSNSTGLVKGYIKNPLVELQTDSAGNLSLPETIGRTGSLVIIKDLGLKEPVSGQVDLIAGDLSQDFTYYMAISEQIPSAISLSVLLNGEAEVEAAGGFMIQVLPGADDETIAQLEMSLKKVPNMAKLLAAGTTPEKILTQILGTDGTEFLTTTPVAFKCDCSKEKFGAAIISLGATEIAAMIEEDHGAEAVCSFCNTHYHYSEAELHALAVEAQSGPADAEDVADRNEK